MNLPRKNLRLARRGAVSLIFATALIPMLMLIGLAIDYGIYNEAESQLDMAADAAAIHAARIASELLQRKVAEQTAIKDGEKAGQEWFLAQLGILPQADKKLTPDRIPQITVSCNSACKSVSATVNYTGLITTHFSGLFPHVGQYWPDWGIGGTATAVISVPSYVEVLMLLDNSSSMLIAGDANSIQLMDALTPCSAQGANEKQPFDYNYSWVYAPGATQTNPPGSAYSTNYPAPGANPPTINLPYGYGTFIYPKGTGNTKVPTPYQEVVPPTQLVGHCDSRFTGGQYGISCTYPGTILQNSVYPAGSPKAGQCIGNNLGGPGSIVPYTGMPVTGFTPIQNMPQAPCAFACHTDPNNNDYYGIYLNNQNTITLRLDYVRNAAEQVATTMASNQDASQLSIVVYDFNAPIVSQNGNPALIGFNKIYPDPKTTPKEATYDLANAYNAIKTLYQPPLTPDQGDTDLPLALTDMAAAIAPTDGSGTTTANPEKNLFIVTDGLADYYKNGVRIQETIDVAQCQAIKNLGVKIYVLYTLYLPLPNPFYLTYDQHLVEPVNANPPIQAALRACASTPPPNSNIQYFYEADNSQEIGTALTNMLASALGSPGRISE